MNCVVLISADAEWDAVKRALAGNLDATHTYPFGEWFRLQPALLRGSSEAAHREQSEALKFFHGGWGKISAAASAQFIIDHFSPDLIVNLGTCGGFEGRLQAGAVLLVDRTVVYDLIEEMTDPDAAKAHYASALDLSWLAEPYPHRVSRVVMASADRDLQAQDIAGLVEQYGAVAADWESAAIAWVAGRNRTRLLILRGVSDIVGGAGGEVYGKPQLFSARTRTIMTTLLQQLPDWLNAIKV
ncbi:MAG TPA: 5'-methylthioadenosine/S-adenosylhomocysteine nucleosidase [Anaerolineales bacterium]|jgi:adenosylhomocysteine nucleosidase